MLDPFAGMGTALVAANALGIDAVGYEPQVFFHAMANAKTSSRNVTTVERIRTILTSLKPHENIESLWNATQLIYLRKLVDAEQLSLLATARVRESELSNDEASLYRLIVSKLLERASGSSTDGIYKAPTTTKRSRSIDDSLDPILDMVVADIQEMPIESGRTNLYRSPSGDMNELGPESVDLVITSPPYLNNFDFAEMARMELYFWGYADSWANITEKVRRRLVVNTTTAPTDLKKDQARWRDALSSQFLLEVEPLIAALLETRKERGGSKEYEQLVLPYFAQMRGILAETYRVLRDGGALDLIVADSALYGVHIHTEVLLAQLMEEVGFSKPAILRLRDRGGRWILKKRIGSTSPLGEFHITTRKGNR